MNHVHSQIIKISFITLTWKYSVLNEKMNTCFPCERKEVALSAEEKGPWKTLNDFFLFLPPEAIARCNLTRQINFNIFPIMLTSFISLFITAIEAKQVVIYGRNLPINYYPYDLTIPAVFILDLLIMWILCLYPAVSNIKRS